MQNKSKATQLIPEYLGDGKFQWFVFNPFATTLIFFALIASVLALISNQRYELIQKSRIADLDEKVFNVRDRIYNIVNSQRHIAVTLALSVDNETGEVRNFEKTAQSLLQSNPELKAVQLVPDGIIKYSYPLKGNEKAIGVNLFESTPYNRAEALKAIERRYFYMQGPFELTQGGMALVGRAPIYIKGKFWGFTAAVLPLDIFLKEIKLPTNLPNFYLLQLSKRNPVSNKEDHFFELPRLTDSHLVRSAYIEEGNWTIAVIDNRIIPKDIQFWLPALSGLMLAVLSSFFLYQFLQKQAFVIALSRKQFGQIKDTESKYKAIFDNAAIGIAKIHTPTGEIVECNDFFCKMLGYRSDELLGVKIKSILHQDDLQKDSELVKLLRNKERKQNFTMSRFICRDNHFIWANVFMSRLWTDDEEPTYHIKILDDITEQIENREALRTAKMYYEQLLNSIEAVVWEADLRDGGKCTYMSSKITEMLGYTVAESLGRSNLDRVHEDDKAQLLAYYQHQMLTKNHHINEYRVRARDGRIVWVHENVTVSPNVDNPQKLMGIMIDITENKESREALNKSYVILNEQNKRLLNFSYIVSHNLRSHTSNIEGISTLIFATDDNQERNELLAMLQKVVSNLNETIMKLNSFVSIRANIDIAKSSLNLSQFINQTLESLATQIVQSDADIINEVPVNTFVYFNNAYLESVLVNLLTNAIRYSDPNRKLVIRLLGKRFEEGYLFLVSDNGLGINLDAFGKKLFGLNQTFHNNTDARGFGLFITKSQIESMGGTISVESKVGQGTTFKVFFPIA